MTERSAKIAQAVRQHTPRVIKRTFELTSVFSLLILLALGVWLISTHVTFNSKEWSMFFNYRIPLLISQISPVILVMLILDWSCPGWAIRTIMHIKPDSLWQEKAIAAAFLLGVGLLICIATRA